MTCCSLLVLVQVWQSISWRFLRPKLPRPPLAVIHEYIRIKRIEKRQEAENQEIWKAIRFLQSTVMSEGHSASG